MAEKPSQCEHPCASVSEFIGSTRVELGYLSKDLENIRYETKECLGDMKASAQVIRDVKESLVAVAETTKQQNIRLKEGDNRFVSHERRMGEVEKSMKSFQKAMEDLPDCIEKAMDKHIDKTHKPILKKIRILFFLFAGVILFLLGTEHGQELIEFVNKLNPIAKTPI
jgi:chromosome segregation ATPase